MNDKNTSIELLAERAFRAGFSRGILYALTGKFETPNEIDEEMNKEWLEIKEKMDFIKRIVDKKMTGTKSNN